MHKKLDLRTDQQAEMSAGDLNSAVNDQDGDGFDDRTGEPIEQEDEQGADDVQPVLSCPACGFEAPAAEPTSINTEDPEAGSTGDGAAEGDLCPNCGQGLLEPAQDLGEGMEGQGPGEESIGDQKEQNAEEAEEIHDEEFPDENPEENDEDIPEDEEEQDPREEEDDEEEEKPARRSPFPPKK